MSCVNVIVNSPVHDVAPPVAVFPADLTVSCSHPCSAAPAPQPWGPYNTAESIVVATGRRQAAAAWNEDVLRCLKGPPFHDPPFVNDPLSKRKLKEVCICVCVGGGVCAHCPAPSPAPHCLRVCTVHLPSRVLCDEKSH